MRHCRHWLGAFGLVVAAWLAACSQQNSAPTTAASAPVPATGTHTAPSIAWRKPDGANMDAVFALARQQNLPVFLYWGAAWCPPCNQVKSTVFQRPEFIERSQRFVPVYVDGDAPGAQQIGERFHVRGYPTMIVLRPDQTEITRLPGEVDAARYLEALDLAIGATSSVKSVLQAAQQGQRLDTASWRQLAYYAWEQDAAQVLPAKSPAGTLWNVAVRCPEDQLALRLRLLARASSLSEQDHRALTRQQTELLLGSMQMVLSQPDTARELLDVLSNDVDTLYAGAFKKASGGSVQQPAAQAWMEQLQGWSRDTTLSGLDRLSAMAGWVHLGRLLTPHIDEAQARSSTAWVVDAARQLAAKVTDPYERQALIPAAADLLSEVGRLDESDALLQAELAQAPAPYYHMLMLSGNARKRGDRAAALDWAERAWKASVGPATRLQWGTGYLTRLIELTPQDESRIVAGLQGLLQEVDIAPENFVHRNARQMERLATSVQRWTAGQPQRARALQPVRAQWEVRCTQLPKGDPTLATCRRLFISSKA